MTAAALQLGKLLADRWDPPDLEGAIAAFRLLPDDSIAGYAVGVLLHLRLKPPDLAGAVAAYERAADAGSASAAHNLGVLLYREADPPEYDRARAALRRAADGGLDHAHLRLAALEALIGDESSALAAWRTALVSSDQEVSAAAGVNLAALAAARGDIAAAHDLLEPVAEQGEEEARVLAAVLVPDSREEARAQLVEVEGTWALNFRGVVAYLAGDVAEARKLWSASMAEEDSVAPLLLALLDVDPAPAGDSVQP